jgi:hypothetical protein
MIVYLSPGGEIGRHAGLKILWAAMSVPVQVRPGAPSKKRFGSFNQGASSFKKAVCRSSSVGRAQPCQGWGRGFESRLLLSK